MNQTITKNPENISILRKLITNGHYYGYVRTNKFELKRNHYPNNLGIFGTLDKNEKFQIESDFTNPMRFFVRFFDIMGILISLGLIFIKSSWTVAIVYFFVRLVYHVYVNVKRENEIQRFTIKFSELKRLQEE